MHINHFNVTRIMHVCTGLVVFCLTCGGCTVTSSALSKPLDEVPSIPEVKYHKRVHNDNSDVNQVDDTEISKDMNNADKTVRSTLSAQGSFADEYIVGTWSCDVKSTMLYASCSVASKHEVSSSASPVIIQFVDDNGLVGEIECDMSGLSPGAFILCNSRFFVGKDFVCDTVNVVVKDESFVEDEYDSESSETNADIVQYLSDDMEYEVRSTSIDK